MTAAAERQRRRRLREKAGLIVLPIEVDDFRIAEALIATGKLTEEQAQDKRTVAAALADVLADWAERHA